MKIFSRNNLSRISVAALVLMGTVSPLLASEPVDDRPLTIYEDAAGSGEILAKEYDDAIEIISSTHATGVDKILLANNLCVAYTLAGNLVLAETACDNAIHEASRRKNYGDDWFKINMAFRTQRLYTARAFANRSVLRKVAGNVEGSDRDSERAVALNVNE